MSKRKWKVLPILALLASVALWSGQACAEDLLTRKDGSQYLGFLTKDKQKREVFVTCNGTRFSRTADDKIEATDELCPKKPPPGFDMAPPPPDSFTTRRNSG